MAVVEKTTATGAVVEETPTLVAKMAIMREAFNRSYQESFITTAINIMTTVDVSYRRVYAGLTEIWIFLQPFYKYEYGQPIVEYDHHRQQKKSPVAL